jgi:hypothetical protein
MLKSSLIILFKTIVDRHMVVKTKGADLFGNIFGDISQQTVPKNHSTNIYTLKKILINQHFTLKTVIVIS